MTALFSEERRQPFWRTCFKCASWWCVMPLGREEREREEEERGGEEEG